MLTKQTEQRKLCGTLLELLNEMLAPNAHAELLELYVPQTSSDVPLVLPAQALLRRFPSGAAVPIPGWLPLILTPFDARNAVRHLAPSATGSAHHVFYVGEFGGTARVVTLEGERIKIAMLRRLRALLTIFVNSLALLDKFERDPLTGLLNRQSFDYRFEHLVTHYRDNPRRERVRGPPWLAIADIDHFKRVNDLHGHLFGDEILLLFSRVMRQSFRFDDLLFRYGGEEFVVILHNTNTTGAARALERFRAAVESFEFPRVGRATISLGWVAVRPNEPPVNQVCAASLWVGVKMPLS